MVVIVPLLLRPVPRRALAVGVTARRQRLQRPLNRPLRLRRQVAAFLVAPSKRLRAWREG